MANNVTSFSATVAEMRERFPDVADLPFLEASVDSREGRFAKAEDTLKKHIGAGPVTGPTGSGDPPS